MTDPIAVTITETPIQVSIINDTPAVTVTDLNTQIVTVLDASPQVLLHVDQQPKVVVNTGIGGAYDTLTLLGMLEGALSLEQFESGLKTDLEKLQALWIQVGVGSLLSDSEIAALLDAKQSITAALIATTETNIHAVTDGKIGTVYTTLDQLRVDLFNHIDALEADLDTEISTHLGRIVALENLFDDTVLEIYAEIDTRITAATTPIWTEISDINIWATAFESSVNQRFLDQDARITLVADQIPFQLSELETTINGTLIEKDLSITITIDGIITEVSRVETALNGDITSHWSHISQQADKIAFEVGRINYAVEGVTSHTTQFTQTADDINFNATEIIRVEGRAETNESNLTIHAGLIAMVSTRNDDLTGDLDEATLHISALDGIVSTHTQLVAEANYQITAVETLLANQYGVNIVEDANGNMYSTGFQLMLHKTWLVNVEYAVDDTVFSNDTVWKCIVDHTSSSSNSPISAASATYWVAIPDGVKTAFTVQADAFKILTNAGPTPIFSVVGDQVGITGKLTIGPGSTGYDELTDAPSSTRFEELSVFESVTYPNDKTGLETAIDGKIVTWFTDEDPRTLTAWAVGSDASHAGDMWWNQQTDTLKRFTGSGWIIVTNEKMTNAYRKAQDAQDTADGKRRVFYVQPYPPYDKGDLWAVGGSGGDLKICVFPRASGAYVPSDWQLATKYTDDEALDDFVDFIYNPDKDGFQAQVDGKIYTWFQEASPVDTDPWIAGGTDLSHEGDLWWKPSLKELRRYEGSGIWSAPIIDADMVNAFTLANDAKDTADSKRRVFVETPYAPYDKGDLWDRGEPWGLFRCIVGEATSYNYSHWQPVVAADTAYVNGIASHLVENSAADGKWLFDWLNNKGELAILTGLDSVHIANGAIIANKIAAYSIESDRLATNVLTIGNISGTGELASLDNVDTVHIEDGAIKAGKLYAGAVEANKGIIADLAVDTLQIAGQAVTVNSFQTNGPGVSTATTSITVPTGKIANLLIIASASVVHTGSFSVTSNFGTLYSADVLGGQIACMTTGFHNLSAATYTVTLNVAFGGNASVSLFASFK